ncbi:hypothetical protein NLJ89_g5826 [Agrocybe chaxingu]|uniref:P-loop containing nucleoside triphosphate hydrolase protein n=1 Tax=Agrocybe chaxingu TaxID=84603 RepID=A0A9W8MWL0_9AGAR|nr:hypothetical protein NLJ89_g5826 [Agrocybe chaxingu]
MGGGVGVGGGEVNGEEVSGNGGDREAMRERIREWRVERCWEVLHALGPAAYCSFRLLFSLHSFLSLSLFSHLPRNPNTIPKFPPNKTLTFAQKPFTSLPPGEQRLVLLMRALVGRPPVVLLDEVWSGMDDGMVRAARAYLRGESPGGGVDGKNGRQGIRGVDDTQAVIVITHWEEEVPWEGEEVRRFKLG